MLKIWTQIQNFFSKPPSTGGPSIQSMIANWFGRQDFTAVGMRWATELAGAVIGALGAAIRKALSTRAGQIIGGGGAIGLAIGTAIAPGLGSALGAVIGIAVGVAVNHYWPKIRQAGIDAFHAIENAAKKALGKQLWGDLVSLAKSFWDWCKGIGNIITTSIWPAVKKVWGWLGGWHTVITAVVLVIRVIAAAFVIVGDTVRTIYNFLKNLFQAVGHLSGIVGGALLGAFQTVAGVVSAIVGGIQTAIGAAQTLAGALTSLPGSGAYAGPSRGGRHPTVVKPPSQGPTLASLAGGVHYHITIQGGHYSDAASRRREAAEVGKLIVRDWSQRAGH